MRHHCRSGLSLIVLAVVFLSQSSTCVASLLTNGGFDIPTPGLTPPNYPASITGPGAFGDSSAYAWTLYNDTYNQFPTVTSTELVPSTDPNGGGSMIHVTTDGYFNGLQQVFAAVPAGSASVDVFVNSGVVFMGLYAGYGSTLLDYTYSTASNQWQTLSVTASSGNPNLIVIYSYDVAGANFYADGAGALAVPEPSTWVLALVGLPGLGFFRGNREQAFDMVKRLR